MNLKRRQALKALLISILSVLLLVLPKVIIAQATPTVSQTLRSLQVGGSIGVVYPDYSPQDGWNYGLYVDADLIGRYGLTFSFHDASIKQHPGAYELSYEAGLRRSFGSNAYRPYIGADLGRGTFQFAPVFLQKGQNLGYFLYGTTFGLDVIVRPRLSVRGEVDWQHWDAASGLPNGLTPISYTVGVAYRIGFAN
jgi:hypothetical protein